MAVDDPFIPYGDGKKRMRLSELLQTELMQSLDASFRDKWEKFLRENPTVGIGNTDRDDATVTQEFFERYKPLKSEPDFYDPKVYKDSTRGRIKEYDGKIYKLVKDSAAATPNASWHSGGYAVDVVGNKRLAGKKAADYGIRQVTSTDENWHFQPAGVPDGRRVLDFVKNRYGRDILAEPLDDKTLTYFNQQFASNAPYHPPAILSNLDALLGPPIDATVGTRKRWESRNAPAVPATKQPRQPRIRPKGNAAGYM